MLVQRNNQTIEKAFNGFKHNERQFLISGMKGLLQEAVVFALQRHRELGLPAHQEVGDAYGWAIGYQGKCLAVNITVGPLYSDISVRELLESAVVRHSLTKNKYVGIVMAGMDPPQFYKIEHEEEILHDTMDWVAGDFDKYFQKI